MIPDISHLKVYFDVRAVGRLAMGKDRVGLFEYDTEWLQDGFSISPFQLPLESGLFTSQKEPFDGLFGVFNDSLPDGWGNLLIDRWLKENGIEPGRISWVERLAIVGNSGMGALSYQPEIHQHTDSEEKALGFYADEVNKILNEEEVDSLDHWVERAGSPGGARPKILLNIDGIDWLIKFGAQNDPKDIGEIEFNYSKTAKLAGVIMPDTRLFENIWFGTARFDRDFGKRLHMITAAGLLQASHRFPSLDYIELMKATLYFTRSVSEVEKFYRLMVFNVLTYNRDDHAKNFSFIYKNGEWMLSPAYDLVYSIGFNGNHSTTINGKGNPTIKDIIVAGEKAGLSRNNCEDILQEVKIATSELVKMICERFKVKRIV
jgi:serine/threonine-protein kinase HipA